VGDNARVGSNSVVVKDVPAGVTVVGVPAHNVEPKAVPVEPHFDAYGTQDEEDPILKTVEELTQKLADLQKRMKELEQDSEQTAKKWEGK